MHQLQLIRIESIDLQNSIQFQIYTFRYGSFGGLKYIYTTCGVEGILALRYILRTNQTSLRWSSTTQHKYSFFEFFVALSKECTLEVRVDEPQKSIRELTANAAAHTTYAIGWNIRYYGYGPSFVSQTNIECKLCDREGFAVGRVKAIAWCYMFMNWITNADSIYYIKDFNLGIICIYYNNLFLEFY